MKVTPTDDEPVTMARLVKQHLVADRILRLKSTLRSSENEDRGTGAKNRTGSLGHTVL